MTVENVSREWDKFEVDLVEAESKHNEYLKVLKDVTKRQESCSKVVKHLKYTLSQLLGDIKRLEKPKSSLSDEEKQTLTALRTRAKDTRAKLEEMLGDLPATNIGLYLRIILGENLNISLLNPDDRYKYKQDYERFKSIVTYVLMVLLVVAYFVPYKAVDSLCNFLLVWYYCTLTIRESILRVNGSRIKGWWMLHHYIACVLCALVLTWRRDRECYKEFRPLFLLVSFYIGGLQIMQSRYQTGCLRRLHALGQRHEMDVTLEGFSGWMFKGLTFLLPFLIVGYLIQAYCAYYLTTMWYRADCHEDWQVLALAVLFAVMSCGNLFTLLSVFVRKLVTITSADIARLAAKYRPKLD